MKEFAPFVTEPHPFMTEDGWKEFDPATSYLDHNVRNVGVQNVGDRIVRLSGVFTAVGAGLALGSAHAHNEIRIEPFLVERIEGSADDPE